VRRLQAVNSKAASKVRGDKTLIKLDQKRATKRSFAIGENVRISTRAVIVSLFLGVLITPTRSRSQGVIYNSATLLTSIIGATVVHRALDKNPLPLIQLKEQLPFAAVFLPPTVWVFEKVSPPVAGAVIQLLNKKYPNSQFANHLGGSLSRSIGMGAGIVTLRLIAEVASGNLIQSLKETSPRDVGAFTAGLGAGFVASEAFGAGALSLAGATGPIGATVVGVGSLTMFMLTSEPVTQSTRNFFKARENRAIFNDSMRTHRKVLMELGQKSEFTEDDSLNYTIAVQEVTKGFEALQLSFYQEILDLDTDYLSRSLAIQSRYFKKMRLVEWMLAGSKPHDKNDDVLGWQSAGLPLELHTKLSLAPAERTNILENYLENLKRDLPLKLENLKSQYAAPRQLKIQEMMNDKRLHATIKKQFDFIARRITDNFAGVPAFKDEMATLNTIESQDFNTAAVSLAALGSEYAMQSMLLPKAMGERVGLLFAASSRIIETYRRIRRGTYLEDLPERSQSIFLELLAEKSKQGQPAFGDK
jgi:hypothetical protein